jgi:hypothetical protein
MVPCVQDASCKDRATQGLPIGEGEATCGKTVTTASGEVEPIHTDREEAPQTHHVKKEEAA